MRPRDARGTANSTSTRHTSVKVSDSAFHSSKHFILSKSLQVPLNSLYTELISKQTMTNRFKRRSILPHLASMQVLLPTSSSPCLPNNECNSEFHLYQCSICFLWKQFFPSSLWNIAALSGGITRWLRQNQHEVTMFSLHWHQIFWCSNFITFFFWTWKHCLTHSPACTHVDYLSF